MILADGPKLYTGGALWLGGGFSGETLQGEHVCAPGQFWGVIPEGGVWGAYWAWNVWFPFSAAKWTAQQRLQGPAPLAVVVRFCCGCRPPARVSRPCPRRGHRSSPDTRPDLRLLDLPFTERGSGPEAFRGLVRLAIEATQKNAENATARGQNPVRRPTHDGPQDGGSPGPGSRARQQPCR